MRCVWGWGGGKKAEPFFFFFVLIMSSVFLVARIPCYKHFLFRIIFFGFIGTGSAEDVKRDLWRKKGVARA